MHKKQLVKYLVYFFLLTVVLTISVIYISHQHKKTTTDTTFTEIGLADEYFHEEKISTKKRNLDITYIEHIKFFEVTGLTKREINTSYFKNTLCSIDDNHKAGGCVTSDLNWLVPKDDTSTPNECLDATEVILEITYKMPIWIDRENASTVLQKQWDTYYKNLKIHEDGHRDISMEEARVILTTFNEFADKYPCSELASRANPETLRISKFYVEKDRKYDEETRHGETQGASFD